MSIVAHPKGLTPLEPAIKAWNNVFPRFRDTVRGSGMGEATEDAAEDAIQLQLAQNS